jgi:hypothetical protein
VTLLTVIDVPRSALDELNEEVSAALSAVTSVVAASLSDMSMSVVTAWLSDSVIVVASLSRGHVIGSQMADETQLQDCILTSYISSPQSFSRTTMPSPQITHNLQSDPGRVIAPLKPAGHGFGHKSAFVELTTLPSIIDNGSPVSFSIGNTPSTGHVTRGHVYVIFG